MFSVWNKGKLPAAGAYTCKTVKTLGMYVLKDWTTPLCPFNCFVCSSSMVVGL
jgi:hypothetical protein